jgi:D-aminopeptidase
MKGRIMVRIRDFGVHPGLLRPGTLNAITDVAGVRVGHTTVRKEVNGIPWRTGVTAIWPHAGDALQERIYAGIFALNGFGEVTGRSVIEEWGVLAGPIMLTGTNHVGAVHHWTTQYLFERGGREKGFTAILPVVAECDDSYLDGAFGQALGRNEVYAALDEATGGPVAEGCVGAGTGMLLFDFKGGIGTASRIIEGEDIQYTVGVLVLTNFGIKERLCIDGIPVGRLLQEPPAPEITEGSCIVLVATDAPLHPLQCKRLAKRAALGLARTGSLAGDTSGEIILAFSNGNRISEAAAGTKTNIQVLVEGYTNANTSILNNLFKGAVEATEEAVYNALVAAETTDGRDGHVVHAISHQRLQELLRRGYTPAS